MKPSVKYLNSEFINLVNEHIHSKRDRDILIDRYVDGLTYSELYDKYGLTDRQFSRILKQADIILMKLL